MCRYQLNVFRTAKFLIVSQQQHLPQDRRFLARTAPAMLTGYRALLSVHYLQRCGFAVYTWPWVNLLDYIYHLAFYHILQQRSTKVSPAHANQSRLSIRVSGQFDQPKLVGSFPPHRWSYYNSLPNLPSFGQKF